jgi:hypothetical protein
VFYHFFKPYYLIFTWMQQTAMSWLVYRMTNSAFLLWLVGFSSRIPAFFLAPLGSLMLGSLYRREARRLSTGA